MATATYTVPEGNLANLHSHIKRLNKKAAKMGCAPITITEGKSDFREILHPSGDFVKERFVEVTVTGEAPQFSGWSFVGTLNHLKDPSGKYHTILKSIGAIPKQYHNADHRHCDHCNTKRFRRDTFIVQNESGEYKQIGRMCLKDFLGGNDPQRIASLSTDISKVFDGDEFTEIQVRHQDEYYFDLERVIMDTAQIIEEHGYVSRSQARDTNRTCTTSRVAAILSVFNKYEVSPDAEEVALGTLQWLKEVAADETKYPTDYHRNLRTIVNMGVVHGPTLGYACSSVAAYHNRMAELIRQAGLEETRKTSNHVGKVGERTTFTVTVKNVSALQGNWGITSIHRMEDKNGNVIVWFANGSTVLDKGSSYEIKGTVKKHDDYKGIKQTVLSRVAVVQELTV